MGNGLYWQSCSVLFSAKFCLNTSITEKRTGTDNEAVNFYWSGSKQWSSLTFETLKRKRDLSPLRVTNARRLSPEQYALEALRYLPSAETRS